MEAILILRIFSKIRRSQSPIRNAREMIHEYSTTNYVTEVQQPPPPPPDLYQRMTQARTFLQNSLAKQLRDEGLTESQKAANRNQTGALSASSSIPFDASQIVKVSCHRRSFVFSLLVPKEEASRVDRLFNQIEISPCPFNSEGGKEVERMGRQKREALIDESVYLCALLLVKEICLV